ncbi:Centrosomal protein CEP57L1 [Myotis brandtii]|uniref:Centrosomal protein CEP57L1 n=1 Tax=Myotis brandtii TaxID=109478 RepID=S7NM01_MYOBR|nr:Centrosomal protein CEP57L1 [Myotis brandtii]
MRLKRHLVRRGGAFSAYLDVWIVRTGGETKVRKSSSTVTFTDKASTGKIMDSELMHSIVGSYIKPPERIFAPSFTQNDELPRNHHSVNFEVTSPKMLQSPNSQDISIQLSSAQTRCTLLEKQLEYTKRMVLNVEREKNMILEQQTQLQREKEQDQMKLQAKLEKLDLLEKECFKLTTTQKTAEDKIKHLEEKLKEEEHQRKLFQDKASELQTGLEINRILMSSVSNPKQSKEKKKSSKKTKCLKRGPPQQMYSKFGSMPMVSEKPARACHSVNASVQNLLQMVQHYGPQILQKPAEVAEPRCLYKPTRTTSQCKVVPPHSKKSVSICDNLSELLIAMQEELDQMSVEHQELLNQMKETESHAVCEDIECELEHLVKKMEIKREQISKLMKHQDSVRKLQQKVQNSKMSEASCIQREDSNPKGLKNIKYSPRKCLLNHSLQKNSNFHPTPVHNLQMKLRRDDIMWEQ